MQFSLNNQGVFCAEISSRLFNIPLPIILVLLLLASIGNSFIVKTCVCLLVILFPSFFLHYLLQLYCKKELSLHPNYSIIQLYLFDYQYLFCFAVIIHYNHCLFFTYFAISSLSWLLNPSHMPLQVIYKYFLTF